MRLPKPVDLRNTLLGVRFNQKDLLGMGLIDEIVDEAKLLQRAMDVAAKEGEKVGHGVWGSLKVGHAV